MNWYLTAWKKYAVFSGRSRRRELWWFILINAIIGLILSTLAQQTDGWFWSVITWIYGVLIIIPSIAVQVRRLHDTGRTGWWWFIGFIPIVGTIILIVFWLFDSEAGTNRYGPNPKAA
ncbi:DUF805 domain-containing protein [Haloglycomyces albus]|uniref:DUF805 domain-containing protein n=1 Tax=Haloglycomyces albus TaxID=526067 RepID=UPI00046D4B20|nr:DUF805 domain-containing protein [Haloglycomyces albus]